MAQEELHEETSAQFHRGPKDLFSLFFIAFALGNMFALGVMTLLIKFF